MAGRCPVCGGVLAAAVSVAGIALGGCRLSGGPTETWPVPEGWRGSISGCEEPRVIDGAAHAAVENGWLRAGTAGRAVVACASGKKLALVVLVVERLVIEGPERIGVGDRTFYRVHAVSTGGDELPLDGATAVTWSVPPGVVLQVAPCGDFPLFGCPDDDSAAVRSGEPGTIVITAQFGAHRATLPVVVE